MGEEVRGPDGTAVLPVWSVKGCPEHGATSLPWASNITLLLTRFFGSQFCGEVLSWKLFTHCPMSGIKAESLRKVSHYNLISSKGFPENTIVSAVKQSSSCPAVVWRDSFSLATPVNLISAT